jgi:hypothetical protein
LELSPLDQTERKPKAHTSATKGPLTFLLAVFSAPALEQPEQASPERIGEYRQTQPFYRALWKSVNRDAN